MNEPMTDYQFKTILKMILDIIDNSESVEEIKEKVEKLLDDKN